MGKMATQTTIFNLLFVLNDYSGKLITTDTKNIWSARADHIFLVLIETDLFGQPQKIGEAVLHSAPKDVTPDQS